MPITPRYRTRLWYLVGCKTAGAQDLLPDPQPDSVGAHEDPAGRGCRGSGSAAGTTASFDDVPARETVTTPVAGSTVRRSARARWRWHQTTRSAPPPPAPPLLQVLLPARRRFPWSPSSRRREIGLAEDRAEVRDRGRPGTRGLPTPTGLSSSLSHTHTLRTSRSQSPAAVTNPAIPPRPRRRRSRPSRQRGPRGANKVPRWPSLRNGAQVSAIQRREDVENRPIVWSLFGPAPEHGLTGETVPRCPTPERTQAAHTTEAEDGR